MAKMIPPREVIYVKDVQRITGKKYNAARRLMQKAREASGLLAHHLLTIKDFCLYTRMDEEKVLKYLV